MRKGSQFGHVTSVSRKIGSFIFGVWSPVSLVLCLVLLCAASYAQTGGDGAVTGTVTDSTGAAVSNGTVTATNVLTGVVISRQTNSAGIYNISPLPPGTYSVQVHAKGFEAFTQNNLVIDALHVSGLDVALKPGSETETITVTNAPPALDTTNATLGGTIEGSVYSELPLLMNGQQRDITQFSNLLPGAQVNPGGRSSVIGGTQQRVAEVYVDGLPTTSIGQQGDNRPVFNVVPMDSIDQIQVVTSGFSAEYQGAGFENYTLKSGTNHFHGGIADYIRNTAFDTWGFSAPWATVTNSAGVKGYQSVVAKKPADHQNELSIYVGGPIIIPHLFNGKDKLFFYGTYDKARIRTPPAYNTATIPTVAMRNGDFSQLLAANGGPGYAIYDPTTLTSCTAHSTTGPCRYQFGYGPGATTGAAGNPTATGAAINVIPAGEISPIAQYMEKFLPDTINNNVTGNYVGGPPNGYDNWLYSGKIEYDISPKQRLSFSLTGGNRHAVPYTAGTAVLPVPYLASSLTTVAGHWADLEHTYTFNDHLVNQFKFGFLNFGGPPQRNITEGTLQYEAVTAGITGLPIGQASDEFPTSSFSGSNAETQWANGASGATSTAVGETYTFLDNLQWVKGRHAMTFGIQIQRLEGNASTADTPSTPLILNWNPNETAAVSGTAYTANTGYAYASYMLGAVNSTSDTLQSLTVVGGRYHPLAPYFQDDWKVTSKLTLNLGLRWDYLPTYTEVFDRWSFLNPTITNPVTGNLGALEFAGNTGGTGISCHCRTPVSNYFKNWGPRLGMAYSVDSKTVIRGAFAIIYSHGGGVGGSGGANVGTGQTGFNTPLTFNANGAGPSAGPTFYLNNSTYFQNQGIANTNFGGASYVLPVVTGPTAASEALSVGNYVNSSGAFVQAGSAPGFADPYLAGRAPEFIFFNFGLQRSIGQNLTLTANYAGSQSHFVAGASNIRGIQSGEINPIYFALGAGAYGAGLLSKPATPANVAAAQAILPGCCATPYAGFAAAAATTAGGGQATIAQSLKWMPQFSGTTDTFGVNSANGNYHSVQISLAKRESHGITFNINYTYSKEIDDAGTQRSGYAIPANLVLDGKARPQNRIDRALSTLDLPQSLAAYGVYKLPFGKGKIGGNHLLVRALLGGWETSDIMTYVSGMPLTLTSSACTTTSLVAQGTCMPDLNPAYSGRSPRMNGKWGAGVTALTLGTKSYISGGLGSTPGQGLGGVPCGSSVGPFCNSGPLMIGDAPRTGAFGLRAPNNFRMTSGLRRTFNLYQNYKFTFGADCVNVLNSVTFGINQANLQITTNVNSATFGALNFASADSRDFQFSGKFTF